MSENMQERLIKLEMGLMEQDQTVQELSDMVNSQWREIERLKAKLTTAQEKIVSLEENLPASGETEKPPHY